MFRRLSDWLALTGTERKVILFLAGTVVAGAGVRLYQETFPPTPQFDYSASDSAFAVLSEKPDEESVAEDDTGAASIVNINTASREELMALPGIGAVTAERIIAFRSDSTPFQSIEDLRKVKGISKRKLETLRPLVTVK